jgi:inosose dehydratase
MGTGAALLSGEAVGGPGSFGVETPRDPRNPDWTTVLDATAAAGYTATELGPRGWLPGPATVVGDALQRRGLRPVGSFLDAPLTASHKVLEHAAAAVARWIAGVGGDLLVVVDQAPARQATAGRRADAPRSDVRTWQALLDGARRVAEAAARHGVTAVFHPHAGTRIEFDDEIDAFADAAPELRLCLDTGHAAYCGSDPAALLRRHAERIGYLHLKDVDAAVLAATHARAAGFAEAVERQVFVALGAGSLDFDAIGAALADGSVTCPVLLEQDVAPGRFTTAAGNARTSLDFARSHGLVAEADRSSTTPRIS